MRNQKNVKSNILSIKADHFGTVSKRKMLEIPWIKHMGNNEVMEQIEPNKYIYIASGKRS